jgi:hypothetical protein
VRVMSYTSVAGSGSRPPPQQGPREGEGQVKGGMSGPPRCTTEANEPRRALNRFYWLPLTD